MSQIIGYILLGLTLGYFAFVAHKRQADIWDAIKGEDGKLQVPELVIVIWLVVFPVMALGDAFLGAHAESEVWFSLDTILITALGGRGLINHINKKNGSNKEG